MPSKIVELLETEGAEKFRGKHIWSNEDLDPTPKERQTWTKWDYAALWWGSSLNASAWSAASSLISIGLSFKDSLGVQAIGSVFAAIVIIANSRQGSVYRLGYPVSARSQFGVYGAYFFIFVRAVVAIVWFGIQTYYASQLISVSFRCMFGYKWTSMKPFPESAGITSYDFVAFMITHLIQLPLMYIHPSKLRRAFEVKALLLPLAGIGMTAYSVTVAGGFSSFDMATKTTISGSEYSWAFLNGVNSVIAILCPMTVNQPDLARYAKKRNDAGWPQGLAVICVQILITFFSISTTAGLKIAYNQDVPTWNLTEQCNLILDHHWGAGPRTAVFFVCVIFAAGTILTNVSANSIPFGADTTGLLPRFINIRRGQVIIWILGLAIVPWKFITSAEKFITFLSSYTIIMGSLLGVILCDFYMVRKGNLHLPSLYTGSKDGIYYFTKGVNWRACLIWFVGFIVPFPGLIGAYDPSLVSPVILHIYNTGWLVSICMSFTLYYLITIIFPVQIFPSKYSHVKPTFEHLAQQTRIGVFDDEYWPGPGEDENEDSVLESGVASKEIDSESQ